MDSIKFGNVCFTGLRKQDVLKESLPMKLIATVNAEFLVKANKNKRFLELLNKSCCTLDGQVPIYLAKIIYPKVELQKISGSELIYDFCELAKRQKRKVFLLGGTKESNELAVKKIKETYGIDVEGFSPEIMPYPFETNHNNEILSRISFFKPDIIFVGFGAMKQEFWIDDNRTFLESLGVGWAIGCGGTFEFVSGRIRRAPHTLQILGLESIWRLIQEPKLFRLKRVIYSLPVFKFLLYGYK